MGERLCEVCGAPIPRKAHHNPARYSVLRFCSRDCQNVGTRKHGQAAYKRGCRCDVCCDAWSAAQVKSRESSERHRNPRLNGWPVIHLDHVWQPPEGVEVRCREHFPEVFDGRDNALLAARICRGCPVISDCYAAAVRQKEWGTWGGVYFEDGRVISTRSLRAESAG